MSFESLITIIKIYTITGTNEENLDRIREEMSDRVSYFYIIGDDDDDDDVVVEERRVLQRRINSALNSAVFLDKIGRLLYCDVFISRVYHSHLMHSNTGTLRMRLR